MQKQRAVFFIGRDGLKLFLFGFIVSSEPSWMWQHFKTTDGEIRKQRTGQISAKLKSSGFSLLTSFCRKSWGRSGNVLLLVMHFLNLNNFLSCGFQSAGEKSLKQYVFLKKPPRFEVVGLILESLQFRKCGLSFEGWCPEERVKISDRLSSSLRSDGSGW